MELVLGTACAVNLFEDGSNQIYSQIFSRVREIDRTMNFHAGEFHEMISGGIVDPDSRTAAAIQSAAEALTSGIAAVNARAGIEPVKVRPDIIDVLEKAQYFSEISGGAFDPTIGPLVRLWGIGTDEARVPDYYEIANTLKLVNRREVIIDREAGTVFLLSGGMALDFGAIAKGFAVDEAVRIARKAGVKRGIFDFGGDIYVLGRRGQGRDKSPWRIGIQNPLNERGEYIGVLQAVDKSVVTSGVYERFFESDGKYFHHILSPETGYPVDSGLLSVTVVADKCADADALSTAVFVLGFERGRALINSIPDTEAIFIFDDNNIIITAGLKESFTPSPGDFEITFLD